LTRVLARHLGLDHKESRGRELVGETTAITEANIVKAIREVRTRIPSLWVIRDIGGLLTNRDGGGVDERALLAFEENLATLQPMTLLVATCSQPSSISPRLSRLFTHIYTMSAPTLTERVSILRETVDERMVSLDSKDSILQSIAEKTVGFGWADLIALVDHACLFCNLNSDNHQVSLQDFISALNAIKASRSKSLGLAEVPCVKWEDVGGLEEVKQELLQAVATCGSMDTLKRSGILMHGPPGVGKTLIAKAVATEANMSFISVKGPELLNMYVGQSEENVREIFTRAAEAEPCVVFFDELDSLAPARGQSGDSGGVMDRVVSALLAELDALERMKVIVVGATNRPDLLDSALLRPGRFDKSIYIGPATEPDQILSILTALTRKLNVTSNVDLHEVVRVLPPGLSGADLSSIVSNAALSAAHRAILAEEAGEVIGDEHLVVSLEDFLTVAQAL